MNQNNKNESKSDIFCEHIEIWHSIFFIKRYSSISVTFEIDISQFSDYSEPKQQKWSKIRHFFHETYSNLTSFFIGHKIWNYFNEFYNRHFFQFHCKSEYKQVTWNKIKQDMRKSDSIFPYYNVILCLNDFWNLFLEKYYLKK